jgi:hypothetical protein
MQPARQFSAVIRFGVFEADVESGELRKNGVKVKIQDLPFPRAEAAAEPAPGGAQPRRTSPSALAGRSLCRFRPWHQQRHQPPAGCPRGSADNPVFVETVGRRGYRRIAPTHVSSPPTPPQALPGPVLVKPEIGPAPVEGNRVPPAWRWSLVFPAAALLRLVWSVWPSYHAARAGTSKTPAPAHPSSSAAHLAANADAEQFYLKGRFYWEKRTPDGLNKAVDYFTQAIVHDPDYAPAYVGLAHCYNLLRDYTLIPASEAYPRALAAAKKAVELDDQSSEAHASLAFAPFYGTRDTVGADGNFVAPSI